MLISSIIKSKESELQKKENLKQSAIDFFQKHLDMPGGFKDRIEKDIKNNLGDQYKVNIDFNLIHSASQNITSTHPNFIVQISYNKQIIFVTSYDWYNNFFSKNTYTNFSKDKLYSIHWKVLLNPSNKDLIKVHNKIYNVLVEDIKDNIRI